MPWTRPSVSSLPLAHYDGGRGSRRSCSAARAMNRCHTFGRHWNRMLSKRFQRQQWSQKCSWRWSGYLLCNRSKSSRRKCPTFVATITKGRHFLDSGSCWTAVSVMLACQPLWRCKCPQGVLVRLRGLSHLNPKLGMSLFPKVPVSFFGNSMLFWFNIGIVLLPHA